MQACWNYVCSERTAEDNRVERGRLTATRLIQYGVFICIVCRSDLFGHGRPYPAAHGSSDAASAPAEICHGRR